MIVFRLGLSQRNHDRPPLLLVLDDDRAVPIVTWLSGEPRLLAALNDNFAVTSGGTRLFVRRHQGGRGRAEISFEQGLMEWVAERDIPVIPPRPDRDGQTALDYAGARWSVFPWVSGRSLVSLVHGEVAVDG